MGYKILDVKADIHEDVEKYFVQLNDIGHDLGYTGLVPEQRRFNALTAAEKLKEDVLDIVDKHFEKIER